MLILASTEQLRACFADIYKKIHDSRQYHHSFWTTLEIFVLLFGNDINCPTNLCKRQIKAHRSKKTNYLGDLESKLYVSISLLKINLQTHDKKFCVWVDGKLLISLMPETSVIHFASSAILQPDTKKVLLYDSLIKIHWQTVITMHSSIQNVIYTCTDRMNKLGKLHLVFLIKQSSYSRTENLGRDWTRTFHQKHLLQNRSWLDVTIISWLDESFLGLQILFFLYMAP